MTQQTNSIRNLVMEHIRKHLREHPKWHEIETEVGIMCTTLPIGYNDEKRKIIGDVLQNIKDYLIAKDVSDVSFLDDEIDVYAKTKQITLYEEHDNYLDPLYIKRYSRFGYKTEGIVGIHVPLNYEQLIQLTNAVYRNTDLVKFFISKEKTVSGKIVAEIFEQSQKIPIARLVMSKRTQKGTDEPLFKKIFLFGQKIEWKSVSLIKEITAPFYIYRLITNTNEDYILLSTEKHEIGDYMITGVVTNSDDYKALTDSAKIPTKLPYLFAQKCINRIIQYETGYEFKHKIKQLGISGKTFFEYPFVIEVNGKKIILKHPRWFKNLIWAWILHANIGIFNNYPLHILILGEKHSGKSLLLNSLHAKSNEIKSVFSGVSSTLKRLVPSFKYKPAAPGYLAESNRFGYCDEFLRCLSNSRTAAEGSSKEEGVAIMNDLLEHQKREAGSGVAQITINMTARIIAASNPIRGIHTLSDLLQRYDHSFCSRFLIYFQSEEHVRLIQNSIDTRLEKYQFKMRQSDWISIVDYLQSIKAKYDLSRLQKIFSAQKEVLSEELNNHYKARHMHHLECIMDGVIKTRCLFTHNITFEAHEVDYVQTEQIWCQIIKSWVDLDHISHLPISKRFLFMPESCQELYRRIQLAGKPLSRVETEELSKEDYSRSEYITAMVLLLEHGLLTERDGLVFVYGGK